MLEPLFLPYISHQTQHIFKPLVFTNRFISCSWPLYKLNMYLEDNIITENVNMVFLLKASGTFYDSIPWFFSSDLS